MKFNIENFESWFLLTIKNSNGFILWLKFPKLKAFIFADWVNPRQGSNFLVSEFIIEDTQTS